MTKKSRKTQGGLPDKEEIRRFIVESAEPVGKREVARAFNIKGQDKIALKAMLRELEEEGRLAKGPGKKLVTGEGLPKVAVLEVTGTDADGEVIAKPHNWRGSGEPPRVYIAPEKRSRSAVGAGDRVLARTRQLEPGVYEAQVIRVLTGKLGQVLGIYDPTTAEGRLHPTDRRAKNDYILTPEHAGEAEAGELVLAEVLPRNRAMGLQQVRVVERLGDASEPKAISLISIHVHNIPMDFPAKALEQAQKAGPVSAEGRVDLRQVPLVTIDGADARDFDDAVWAEPDSDPDNPDGWHILVAIADVAHYVPALGPLDEAAQDRGNSVYFPDRVVPMLPEALSNGWCSLRPDEERGCLACEIWIDREGKRRDHRFHRAIMRSAARLTYEQVQAAVDGRPDDTTGPLLDSVIKPLYGAYGALERHRQARGTLDLDIPEREVVLDETGNVKAIRPRKRLTAHKLIEEFMIAANVSAAVSLEERNRPCLYRVHESPDPQKVEALGEFLGEIGVRLAKGQAMRPEIFARILDQVRGTEFESLVNTLVLRAQSQAYYSPQNLGHFGLALPRYAHFTSPIRRYSDLIVHRSLISNLGLGGRGLPDDQVRALDEIAEHVSTTERRAIAAEREAMDRYTAAYLSEQVGQIFEGRINGVTRFGLFVTLAETGADGLIPISSLPDDYYDHVEEDHALVGRRWGRRYRLGEGVAVRLEEANPITGGLIFTLAEEREDRNAVDMAAGAKAGKWDPLGPPPSTGDAATKRGKPKGGRKGKPKGGRKGGPKRGKRSGH